MAASCNALKRADLGRLQRLSYLDLRRNGLGATFSLPALALLAEVFLGHNALRKLDLKPTPVLATVDVSNNDLARLPDALVRAPARGGLRRPPDRGPGRNVVRIHTRAVFGALLAADARGGRDISEGAKSSGTSSRFDAARKPQAQCPNLASLDASNNDLADVPAALGYLPKLHRLALDGNPLRAVRRDVVRRLGAVPAITLPSAFACRKSEGTGRRAAAAGRGSSEEFPLGDAVIRRKVAKGCEALKAYLRTRGPSALAADGPAAPHALNAGTLANGVRETAREPKRRDARS